MMDLHENVLHSLITEHIALLLFFFEQMARDGRSRFSSCISRHTLLTYKRDLYDQMVWSLSS